MKICLITDTHFGIHKSSKTFLKSQMKFFNKEFIPYLKKNDINTIIIPGDIFDARNSLNVMILNEVYALFDRLSFLDKIYIIVGNHDTYFKTNISVNSLKGLNKYKNIEVIEENKVITLNDKKILLSPWQIDYAEFINYINKNKADICIGHFDIDGFRMNKFKTSDTGFNSKLFQNFDLVFSGHFHIRDKQKRHGTDIIYIGSPYALDRNDSDQEKGFCELNLDDLSYKFINNKTSIKYITIKYPQSITEEMIQGNVVDVCVDYDADYVEEKFQKYLIKVQQLEPISTHVKLINNFLSGDESIELENYQNMNVENLIQEYINGLDLKKQKDEINYIINELYDAAKESV